MAQKKILAALLAGAMALGLIPAVSAEAATNKVLKVPVNFTNPGWEDDLDSVSRSQVELWSNDQTSQVSAYSDSYTVSYKLYIPQSMLKEGSAVGVDSSIDFNDASEDEWKWAGWANCPHIDFIYDRGEATYWDEALQEDVKADYAAAKKSGGYWVIDYSARTEGFQVGDAPSDASKASAVAVGLTMNIKGILISSKDAVYVDDVRITKPDGTTVYNQDFNGSAKDAGSIKLAPKTAESDPSEAFKTVTLPDTTKKTLTVSKKSLTVKVGKKVTIKATAKPAAKITYKSSNRKVATVNSKGVVTGKKAGKATITVKANGKTVKVTVTVQKSQKKTNGK